MKKKNYSFVLSKAESFITDPKNRKKSGELKSIVKKKVDKMITRIVYLSQFEEQSITL